MSLHRFIRSLSRGEEQFFLQYMRTALWSTNDESDESGGVPLDKNFTLDDLADETWRRMWDDCAKFIDNGGRFFGESRDDCEAAGHDFWLTRNGHGAGFWDGDWPEPQASQLTKLAHSFGEVSLYVGDDGMIYQERG